MRFVDLVELANSVKSLPARQDAVVEISAFLGEQSASEAATAADLLVRLHLLDGVDEDDDDVDDPMSHDVAPYAHSVLSCDEVTTALGEIDRAADHRFRQSLTHRLLSQATHEEQRWIGIAIAHDDFDRPTFDLIVSSVARSAQVPVRDVRRAATVCGSLQLATRIALERGEPGLQSVAFQPGRPIRPTVAEVIETPNVLIDPPVPAILEWHVAADRIQVHRRRSVVTVYNERLDDITHLVPTVVEQVASFPRGDIVLDGWADIDASHAESRATASWTRRGRGDLTPGGWLFFDILFDGASVVDEPLRARRELLATIVPERARLPTLDFDDLDAITATMNETVRLGHGHLVLKPLDDSYEGGQTKSSWRLIPATDVVRLAVIAAERGTGDRSHLLSTVHLAARTDDGGFEQVGKTARGLTADTIVWQTRVLAELTLDDDDESRSGSGDLFRVRPDVVAIVAIEGVDRSDRFDVGLGLRNPRVLGYNQEIDATVTSVEALREIAQRDQGGAGEPVMPRLPPATTALAAPALPAPAVGAQSTTDTTDPRPSPPTGRPPRPVWQTIAGADFEPYREPPLSTSRAPWRAVLVARAGMLAWCGALLVAGILERSSAGSVDTSGVTLTGWFGVVVAATLVVSGWAWSDQLVRNTIRLDGRRPSRARCVSAWLLPAIATVVLAVALVPLEPTQPADIRPIIIVGLFAGTMWRPYSLIRRILTTLTPLRSDVLIASAYIIDALVLGLLWWRLTLWNQRVDTLTPGEVDVLVGTVAAVTVAAALGLLIWVHLLRAADEAMTQRRTSQRTRYEHRMLRLRGIDPSDPEVWWALVQRREDERRAAEAQRATDAGEQPEPEGLPSVDTLIESTRTTHSTAFRRLGEEGAARLERRLREQFEAIVGRHEADPLGDQQSARTARGPLPDPHPGGDIDREVSVTAGRDASDADADDLEADPVDALRRSPTPRSRPTAPAERPSRSDIEALLQRAGMLQIEAALVEHRSQLTDERDTDLVPPTLYPIEATRLLMVAALGASALVGAWLVTIALGLDLTAGSDELSDAAVSNLNLARRVFWGLFTAAAALVPAWSLVMMRKARQAGLDVPGVRRVRVLAGFAVVACLTGFVVDWTDRGLITLLLTVAIVWAAVSAGLSVEPVCVWYELPPSTLTAWVATLPVIVGLAWLAGLSGSFEADASLPRLAFTTILLSLACARATVIAVLSSLDLEDKLRTSPELAVPARTRRRR